MCTAVTGVYKCGLTLKWLLLKCLCHFDNLENTFFCYPTENGEREMREKGRGRGGRRERGSEKERKRIYRKEEREYVCVAIMRELTVFFHSIQR